MHRVGLWNFNKSTEGLIKIKINDTVSIHRQLTHSYIFKNLIIYACCYKLKENITILMYFLLHARRK